MRAVLIGTRARHAGPSSVALSPALLRIFTTSLLVVTACSLREPVSPIQPAAPLPADPPVTLDTMKVECDSLLAALETYKACPNHDKDDAEDVEAWITVATRNITAGTKVDPEPNAQKAIAGACHRATRSIKAANARCLVTPKKQRSQPREL